MHIETHDSMDDLQAAVAHHGEAAMLGLADAQRSIDLGDHWVQFYDLDAHPPMVIFGRVATEQQLLDDFDPDDDEGTLTECIARERGRLAETGLMYGEAFSHPYPDGEWGYTHKASVWPIDLVLFNLAKAAEWDINRLGADGRALLQIAFNAHRTHLRAKVADPHDPKPVTRDEVREAIAAAVGRLYESVVDVAADAVMALINRA